MREYAHTMISRACGLVGVGCSIFLLFGCESMGNGAGASSSSTSLSCEETDPLIKEIETRLEQNFDTPEGETYANQIFQNVESRIALLPSTNTDGSCSLRLEDWTSACDSTQISTPMHGQLLQCRQTDAGIAFVLPPFSIYPTENIILRAQRVNQPWNGENRIAQDVGEETVGHVPVRIWQQKDPIPDDCDPNDPCAWEWTTAPFHYEISGDKLFREIIDFVTKRLLCLNNTERCPPTQ